jgi:alginate O-acetyltransferase complex protein AlgI
MRSTSLLQLAYKVPFWLVSIGWAAMLVALALSQESTSSFIYFQF